MNENAPDPDAWGRVERLRSSQLRAVGTAFLRVRPLIVGSAVLPTVALLFAADVPARQRIGLTVGFTSVLTVFVIEAYLAGRRPVGERALFRSLLLTIAVLAIACVMSGGATSPMVPLLFAPTVTTFAAFGRRRETALAFGLFTVVVVTLAALPAHAPFPPIPTPFRHVMLAIAALASAALLLASVAGLTDAFVRAGALLDRMRDDVVADSAARTRALEAMGARLAHEIKNPLSAVKGLVELLAADATEPRAQKRFAVIDGEIARLEATLRDYLSFSRPLEEIAPEACDVAQLAAEVVAVLDARAARAGVALTARGEACPVHVDARRTKAALLNLLTNALEATPRGGTVDVTWSAPAEGDHATLIVRDSGRGMAPHVLARVGTPFFTTRDEGTGLGALLAKATLEQQGGALRFESVEGQGTTAEVRLPKAGRRPGESTS